MAKTKISEYDSNPANNTDVDGVNIAEGCPPSGINNAVREVMSHLKNWQDGSSGDNTTVAGTLNITGNLHLDGSAGTSGYYLKSQGTGVTPVWSALTIGSMGTQDSNAVNITGGSITGLTTLSTSGGTISATTLSATTVTASTTLNIGANWSAVQSGTDIVFKYNGVNKMKVDSSGNLTVTGNVTAYGTV